MNNNLSLNSITPYYIPRGYRISPNIFKKIFKSQQRQKISQREDQKLCNIIRHKENSYNYTLNLTPRYDYSGFENSSEYVNTMNMSTIQAVRKNQERKTTNTQILKQKLNKMLSEKSKYFDIEQKRQISNNKSSKLSHKLFMMKKLEQIMQEKKDLYNRYKHICKKQKYNNSCEKCQLMKKSIDDLQKKENQIKKKFLISKQRSYNISRNLQYNNTSISNKDNSLNNINNNQNKWLLQFANHLLQQQNNLNYIRKVQNQNQKQNNLFKNTNGDTIIQIKTNKRVIFNQKDIVLNRNSQINTQQSKDSLDQNKYKDNINNNNNNEDKTFQMKNQNGKKKLIKLNDIKKQYKKKIIQKSNDKEEEVSLKIINNSLHDSNLLNKNRKKSKNKKVVILKTQQQKGRNQNQKEIKKLTKQRKKVNFGNDKTSKSIKSIKSIKTIKQNDDQISNTSIKKIIQNKKGTKRKAINTKLLKQKARINTKKFVQGDALSLLTISSCTGSQQQYNIYCRSPIAPYEQMTRYEQQKLMFNLMQENLLTRSRNDKRNGSSNQQNQNQRKIHNHNNSSDNGNYKSNRGMMNDRNTATFKDFIQKIVFMHANQAFNQIKKQRQTNYQNIFNLKINKLIGKKDITGLKQLQKIPLNQVKTQIYQTLNNKQNFLDNFIQIHAFYLYLQKNLQDKLKNIKQPKQLICCENQDIIKFVRSLDIPIEQMFSYEDYSFVQEVVQQAYNFQAYKIYKQDQFVYKNIGQIIQDKSQEKIVRDKILEQKSLKQKLYTNCSQDDQDDDTYSVDFSYLGKNIKNIRF